MRMRLPSNPNLSVTNQPYYKGMRIYMGRGPLIIEYLDTCYQVLNKLLNKSSRFLAVRLDAHTLNGLIPLPSMAKFIASLKAMIQADQKRKAKVINPQTNRPVRVHQTSVDYIAVRETGGEGNQHYHIMLFLNLNAYRFLGKVDVIDGNLSSMIQKAWCRALQLDVHQNHHLIHFPENACYHVDKYAPDFATVFGDVFFRLSYFAKVETKTWGTGSRSFFASRT